VHSGLVSSFRDRQDDAVLIYKILLPSEWAEFEAAGRFDGSPFDRSCGFIHCSSREQVGGTALRVFGKESALVVMSVDAQVLDESLRWEAAPNGDPFPHVYAPRPRARIRLPQPGLPVTRVGHHPSGVPHRDGRLTQDHRTPAAASCHAAIRALRSVTPSWPDCRPDVPM
jgi:uncharacterized protein (DUF952 family)